MGIRNVDDVIMLSLRAPVMAIVTRKEYESGPPGFGLIGVSRVLIGVCFIVGGVG